MRSHDFNPSSTTYLDEAYVREPGSSLAAETQVIPIPISVGAWTTDPQGLYRGRHRRDATRRLRLSALRLVRRQRP
jgi:hypothetical protein